MNENWAVARRCAFVALSAVMVAACRGTLPSPPPTTEPAPVTIAPEVASPSPAATPLESAPPVDPTAVPPATPATWADAGELPMDGDVSVVPLADGGAVAIGSVYTEDSSHMAAFRWAPGTKRWDEIEPLNKARTQFGATLLRDGRVLVAGGLNDATQSFSSAYVFDPERPSAGWSKVGLLDAARTAPSIAALPDGRVLIAGGYFRTEEGYGYASPSGLAAPRGTPPWETTSARRGINDVDVPPYGHALATAELFDPDTGEWTTTGSLNYARAGAPAVTLSDGRVMIVGTGQDTLNDVAPEAWTTAEIYDPDSGTFALAGSLPAIDQSRLRDLGVDMRDSSVGPGNPGRLVALQEGGALLVGRNHWAKHDADVLQSIRFDPARASWEETGSPCAVVGLNSGEMRRTPPPCLIGGFVAGLDGGRVLSAGRGPSMEFDAEPRSAAIYDTAADAWLEQPSMPDEYFPGMAVGLTDGTALVVGGRREEDHFATLRFVPPR